ncbi:MAG TPA: 50S ribosomal protein L25 [Gemmatimonadales bacterium]
MATQATINAAPRAGGGKGAARALRRDGKIPAVLYGRGREAEAIVVDNTALTRLLTQIAAATTIVEVAVEGRAPVQALIREIQRNPVRPADIIHLDLYAVQAGQKIMVEVPVKLIGVPDGVKNFGGVLDQIMHDMSIRVLPAEIPEHIDVDVSALAIGQSIHIADLPTDGRFEIMNDAGQTICTVGAPRAEEVVAPVVEAAVVEEPELIRKAKPEEEAEAEEKE